MTIGNTLLSSITFGEASAAGFLLAAAGTGMLPVLLRFMAAHGLTASNYCGIRIPIGTGLLVWLLHVLMALWLGGFSRLVPGAGMEGFSLFALLITVVFVVGWIDDTVGDRTVKGLRGHWRAWRTGTCTSGALKAGGIAAAGLGSLLLLEGAWWQLLLRWSVLVLAANLFNLLDLRPGRAIKAFLGVSGAIMFGMPPIWPVLLPAAISALVLLPGDVKGRHMLGDSGANLLGFAVGFGFCAAAPDWLLGFALFGLVFVHRYAEKSSISLLIEKSRLLHWLDRLGRA